MTRIKRIITQVKAGKEFSGKLNYNEITEIQEAGLFTAAVSGGKYRVVKTVEEI